MQNNFQIDLSKNLECVGTLSIIDRTGSKWL